MGRKPKYTAELQKQAIELIDSGFSFKDAALQTGICEGTLRGWIKNGVPLDPNEIFAKKVDALIDMGMCLIKKRFERALSIEDTLNDLFTAFSRSDGFTKSELNDIGKRLLEINLMNMHEITTAVDDLISMKDDGKNKNAPISAAVNVTMPEEADAYAK